MVEANFVERGGRRIGRDMAADVMFDAVRAYDHSDRIPANQTLDAALEFLIAGKWRFETRRNRVHVGGVGGEWQVQPGNLRVSAEAFEDFDRDFGAAGLEDR